MRKEHNIPDMVTKIKFVISRVSFHNNDSHEIKEKKIIKRVSIKAWKGSVQGVLKVQS